MVDNNDIRGIEVRVDKFWKHGCGAIDLRIRARDVSRDEHVVIESIKWERRKSGCPGLFLHLSREEAQDLMRDLWECGVRPTRPPLPHDAIADLTEARSEISWLKGRVRFLTGSIATLKETVKGLHPFPRGIGESGD